MELKEQVYSLLLVSSAEKFTNSLIDLLPESLYSPVKTVTDMGSAKRELLERSFDLVIINSPLPDDFGTRLAVSICQSSSTACFSLSRRNTIPTSMPRSCPLGC